MRVVITGGAGFLGRKLASALLDGPGLADAQGARRAVSSLLVVDVDVGELSDLPDPRVETLAGDIADPAFVARAFAKPADSVFHLAAVVSGHAEQDFDLGWRVNVDATRLVLEACRRQGNRPRFVFASSVAVYGGELPPVLKDDQALTPQSSYGAQKAVGELLVADYSRKGFLDGRSLRLPTISVRPGKPNKAASSFASGIVREPLNGIEATCPVPRDTRVLLLSPRRAIDDFLTGHDASAEAFGASRSVSVPGLSVTVAEMVEAVRRVAGDEVADRIVFRPDPVIDRIVRTWPRDFEAALGRHLGMTADSDFDAIVRQYIADELAA